jgi:hypothetical protein
MSPGDVAAAISAGSALISLIAAGVAWWRTNLSRSARKAAETARDASQRSLAAIEKIARSLDTPPLTLRTSVLGWVLTSNRPVTLTIEEWQNADSFEVYTPLDLPRTLEGFGSLSFQATPYWDESPAVEVVLRVAELGVVRVALPIRER